MMSFAYGVQQIRLTTTKVLTFALKYGKILLTELNGYC